MNRLIDADALCRYANNTKDKTVDANDIMRFPTVDAVRVVRCKDCRWGREACGNIECNVDLNLPSEYHGYKWFCPNGERREEDE